MQGLDPVNAPQYKMHENILNILFKHKNEIFRKLSDLRGLYFIDHVAITLINPNNEIVVLSLTPSVEFKLIMQGLWKFDMSFNPLSYTNAEMLFWNKAYINGYHNEIKCIKETQHNFSLGFNLIKKIDSFNFIYSFATRKNTKGLQKYYEDLRQELLMLGDYAYKLLRDIYVQYENTYTPPFLDETKIFTKQKSHLKLVVDNK